MEIMKIAKTLNINTLVLADSHRHIEAVLLWLNDISPETTWPLKKAKWNTLHLDSTLMVTVFVQKPLFKLISI